METKQKGTEEMKEKGSGDEDVFVTVEEEASLPQKDHILPISILVAAVMISGALVFSTVYKGGASGSPVNNPGVNNNVAAAGNGAAPSASTTALLALGSRDAILGNANAPVTVIEYGDYQCPFCAQYFSNIQSSIVQNYVNTGKVKMVFRNLPFLGDESIAAAQAADCAEDQNKLWAYHDALYTAKLGDDGKGGTENDGSLNRTLFMSIASQLHMDTTAFAGCIDSGKYANLVAQEKADAEAVVGGDSTPSTFVNGAMIVDAKGSGVGANPTAVMNAIAAAVNAAK